MIRDLFIFFEIVRCVLGKFNYNFLKMLIFEDCEYFLSNRD